MVRALGWRIEKRLMTLLNRHCHFIYLYNIQGDFGWFALLWWGLRLLSERKGKFVRQKNESDNYFWTFTFVVYVLPMSKLSASAVIVYVRIFHWIHASPKWSFEILCNKATCPESWQIITAKCEFYIWILELYTENLFALRNNVAYL